MELNEENETPKSSFLLKLRTILNEPGNDEYIKWSKDGKFFIINCENLNAFADNILPQYFKHRNFNSFHRQLNLVQVEENEYENIDNLDEDTKIQKIKENIQKLNNPYKMIFNFLFEKIKSQGFLIEKLKNQYYLFNELSAKNTSYEG